MSKKVTPELLQRAVDLTAKVTKTAAAAQMGIDRVTLYKWLQQAEAAGLKPAEPESVAVKMQPEIQNEVLSFLRRSFMTLDDLVAAVKVPANEITEALGRLSAAGYNILDSAGGFRIDRTPQAAFIAGSSVQLRARPDGTFVFGVIGDKHVGSKYHREDVLADMYKRFEDAGVDAVFDTGNWIDGDARFNAHDVLTHGLDNQCRLLAETHPRIEGVTTYAIWGDDHEGWYASREGINVGKYCEQIMQDAGHDWVDLGFMEAYVDLLTVDGKRGSKLTIVHPGGGSSYAISYTIQKIVESYEGGEKPAVGFYGHYHKLEAQNIRNVWCLQTGTAQDSTPFMRKKRLEAHVGGAIVTLEQDQETGAIVGFAPAMVRYFNRGYYNGRWSKHGPINRAERVINTKA